MRDSTIPPRRSRRTDDTTAYTAVRVPVRRSPADTRDDDFFSSRMPKSAIRYTDTQGHEVIQRGKQRLVIHQGPPPMQRHWLVPAGLGSIVVVTLLIAANWVNAAWQQHQLDVQYGFPRTYQTDAVVGHNDSVANPSHFICENLRGHIVVIEIPGGDMSHSRVYSGPTLFSDQIPVTCAFQDMNGDGKPDLIIHVQDQNLVYLNDGTQFKTQQ